MGQDGSVKQAPKPIDLLVHGSSEVATALGSTPRGGTQLGELSVQANAAVAIDAGLILEVGAEADLRGRYAPRECLDAAGGCVIPGFVDSHTHPVFAGTRENEFEARLAGKSYLDIAAEGGGIASSLKGVRASSEEVLLAQLLVRLDRFLALGTTTVEAKSGYGLSLEDELKCLRVLRAADEQHAVSIVPTFLGAHDYPPEYRDRRQAYEDLVVFEMLPAVAEAGLAEYCDVFTEAHVFSLEATRRISNAARELGLGVRLHVDQLTPLGGAQLAAELGAASADHLEHVSPEGIEALGSAGVVPVLCPMVPLFLRETQEAPGRAMVAGGLAPALATDFNPGSCYVQSMPEVLSWGALRYGFAAGEALTAATLNAACCLGRGKDRGTLESGKRADLVVTDLPHHGHLTYELGRSPVKAVVAEGRVAWRRLS
ncbi:MAG: imidazolonepropionase [Planctomycetota bacterium]|jgi:imidazolonepropionase